MKHVQISRYATDLCLQSDKGHGRSGGHGRGEGHDKGGVHGKGHLQLCMADHALTQDAEQHGCRGLRPSAPSVRWLHIYREEVLVGEWVQL